MIAPIGRLEAPRRSALTFQLRLGGAKRDLGIAWLAGVNGVVGLRANKDDVAATLDRGIALINDLVGVALPRPKDVPYRTAATNWSSDDDVEAHFDDLMTSIFDSERASVGDPTDPDLTGFFATPAPVTEIVSAVRSLQKLDDAALVKSTFEAISLRPLQLEDVFRPGGYVFSKLNHSYWELIAFRAFNALGETYLRPMTELLGLKCAFDELLIAAFIAHRANGGSSRDCFYSNGFSLGVGFNNGDWASTAERYHIPLSPYYRGAMIGLAAYLSATMKAESYVFSDGAFPKLLVWDGRMGEFAELISKTSDAILFVTPTHLAGIAIKNCSVETHNIIVPPRWVYRKWPAVVGYVLGRVSELMARHDRLTILVQAGGLAAPLGILIDLVQAQNEGCEVRYFDMGQALDIATISDTPFGAWIRKSNVAEALNAQPSPFHLRHEG